MFRFFRGAPKKTALAGATAAIAIATPFIAGWEGLRTEAYYDAVGVETICYGHTTGVSITDTATKEQCDYMLQKEVKEFTENISRYIEVDIPDTRKAALASFAYNVGIGNFRRSTLLKKLNAGDHIGACNELRRWVYAGGRKLKGLVRRREAERELCLEGEV